MFGLCCLSRCWAPCVVYRCWSHCFIVSCPFSNHLYLKDFILLVFSSSLLLRIFTYSILILLFISAIHLPFIWEGWISFWQITLLFLHFHWSQAVSVTINLYLSVACLLYFHLCFLS